MGLEVWGSFLQGATSELRLIPAYGVVLSRQTGHLTGRLKIEQEPSNGSHQMLQEISKAAFPSKFSKSQKKEDWPESHRSM